MPSAGLCLTSLSPLSLSSQLSLSDVHFYDNVGTRAVHVLGTTTVNMQGVTVRGHDIASESFVEKEGEAHDGGGMLFSDYSSMFKFSAGAQKVTLTNVTMEGNFAASGGGLMVTAREYPFEVTLTDVKIRANTAMTGEGGGASFDSGINGCSVSIRNSHIEGNLAAKNGGGLSFSGSVDVQIDRSTISSNTASGIGAHVPYRLIAALQTCRMLFHVCWWTLV